jgi:lactoylglutathione lyase
VQLIHICYRITTPGRSIAFYEALGLEKRRELPIRDEAINYFLGVPAEALRELELTHTSASIRTSSARYGRVALTVDDLDATLARLREQGIEAERPPYRVGRTEAASVSLEA